MKKSSKKKKPSKVSQSYATTQLRKFRRFKTFLYAFVLLNLIVVPVAIYVSNRIDESSDAATYAPPLWSSSFEDGNYAFGAGVSSSGNVSVVNEGHNGGKAVKVVHPPNQYYGAAWFPRLSSNLGISPLEDAYFRYYIKPDPNYHFRLEAKIPGLAGNTGNNYFPSGCDAADPNQGWSGRLQWGLGPNYNNQKGRIQTYLYVASPSSNTGGCGFKEEWSSGAELERGKWACIEIRYKMNTVGQSNGVMQGWFNDALKYERSNIRFRNNTNIKTTMMVNQFYHGGTAAWQPIQTQHYLYDKVAISNQRIGCEGSTTSTPTTGGTTTPTTGGTTTPTTGGSTGGTTTPTTGGSTGGTTTPTTGGTTGGSTGGATGGTANPTTGGGTTTTAPEATVEPKPLTDVSNLVQKDTGQVKIVNEIPKDSGGRLVADFNQDGLNDIATDKNNDGFIEPNSEIVTSGATNPLITDTTKPAVFVKAEEPLKIPLGPLGEISISRTTLNNLFIAQIALVGFIVGAIILNMKTHFIDNILMRKKLF